VARGKLAARTIGHFESLATDNRDEGGPDKAKCAVIMKTRLLKYWDRLRTSFWFVPSAMALGAIGLAFAVVAIDDLIADGMLRMLSWVYTGGADGASLMLSTIAGSMITIAGVVFSMTLVALSLASSQLGPRLLRNFMRDPTNQLVIGTFVSTFVYCLLVLRTIRRADETLFVPHLAVTVGVLLALISLAVLIYFIHHVAVSIQADQVVARVGKELLEGIERLFPEQIGHAETTPESVADPGWPDAFDREGRPIAATEDGYLNLINPDALMTLAMEEKLLIRLLRRPGQYIVMGRPLVMVWPGERANDELAKKVNDAFLLGDQRTAAQDIEFSVHQLVEIAVRALSPGINDPFTAITCVDRLGSALCKLAQRKLPSRYRFDEHGVLRIIARVPTFSDIVDAAFNQIRQHARADAAVTIRLLETIAVIARVVRMPLERAALRRHVAMIVRGARDGLPEAEDRKEVAERYQAVVHLLAEAQDTLSVSSA